jgi:hypothetical protein
MGSFIFQRRLSHLIPIPSPKEKGAQQKMN